MKCDLYVVVQLRQIYVFHRYITTDYQYRHYFLARRVLVMEPSWLETELKMVVCRSNFSTTGEG